MENQCSTDSKEIGVTENQCSTDGKEIGVTENLCSTDSKDIGVTENLCSPDSKEIGVTENQCSTDSKEIDATENQYITSDAENDIEESQYKTGGTTIDVTENGCNTEDSNTEDIDIDVTENVAPDGGWGWCVVFGSFLIHVIMGGFQRSNGVVYLELLNKFGKSATETSWVLAIFSTTTLCAGPLVSMLCNKFSLRFVVCLGAIIATSGTVISGFSPNLKFMYFSYGALNGFGRAMVYVPCLVMVGYYFNKRRGIAVGLATSGGGVGSFIFPPLIEHLFNVYDYRGAWLILAAISLNFMISAALFRPLELHTKIVNRSKKKTVNRKCNDNTYEHRRIIVEDDSDAKHALLPVTENPEVNKPEEDVNHEYSIGLSKNKKDSLMKHTFVKLYKKVAKSDAKENIRQSFIQLSLFRNYAFTALCLQILMFNCSYISTIVFFPALVRSKGLTKMQGAYLVSILGIFDAVSRIIISSILDLKRVKRFRLIVYNILMLLIGILTVLIPLMSAFWQFAIISALYGMAAGTYVSQKSVVLVDILGVEKLTNSFGLLLLFQGTGSFIGPIVGGLLRDAVGSYETSFYCGSVGIFIGALILVTGNVWLHIQKKNKY